MILRSIAGLLSPAGPRARLSILTFHRVLSQPDVLLPDEPDIQRFDEELRWLARWFQVLPLDEAASRLKAGTLPGRAAVITFDDGYANNAVNALPILQRHGMSATFFVATSFLDGGRMWNDAIIETVRACTQAQLDLADLNLGRHPLASMEDRRTAINALIGKIKYLEPIIRAKIVDAVRERAAVTLPTDLMMRSDQVVQLHRAGMQIGAHTCTHPILSSITDAEADDEIMRSKQQLEGLLDAPVTLFAYPNGRPGRDYHAKHVDMLGHAGFKAAVSTAVGAATQASDPLQLPRFKPWDRTALRYGVRMLNNLRAPAAQLA
ncbi:polysaccharide deacetylase family protein [Chitinimonas sp. BJB300]|uniref:polysaccharide deacetylase family protein n=1 Tax=Chitinimonas sp. BJB300 TaxID=1559339 RepID=UPI000C0E1CC8|nr:polysaccharide deacetylase family protein [Chitinimonas sp. BJB300]PHV12110.1 carbohydrate esterase family protein [Chitinimonas sp. BJB300]TSJ89062.1 polysaccharide deacetylase family protein [Chitinimonas sp. BJB300]